MSSSRDEQKREYATDEIVVEGSRVGSARPTRGRPLEVRASTNGPLLVSGGARILSADRAVLYEGEKAALCRCGRSGNKPFCDGTHKTVAFEG